MHISVAKAVERVFGIRISRISADRRARLADLSADMKSTIERVQPYTMTSLERVATVCQAVEHVVRNNVPGAFVECGVWRGGSSMAAALTYLRMGRHDVDLCLFDTFEGMSPPTDNDIDVNTGEKAAHLLASSDRSAEVWAYAPLEDVRRNMLSTGYPAERVHLIRGRVEETIPGNSPGQISILRLDTDWYESTKHELNQLFPRLSRNGILIIDDYGAWAGARKAVDEFFAEKGQRPFLGRIDNTGRVYVNL